MLKTKRLSGSLLSVLVLFAVGPRVNIDTTIQRPALPVDLDA